MKANNLALIGARGAGKSKLSRKLGKRAGRVVLSTDMLVSYEAGGLTPAEIVARETWTGFRQREFDLLGKLERMQGVIIDCGGGILVEAPTAPDAPESYSERKAARLKGLARVVYVRRDIDWLVGRVEQDAQRPDLGGDYQKLLQRRLPWYEQAADFVLDLRGDRDVEEGVEVLFEKFF